MIYIFYHGVRYTATISRIKKSLKWLLLKTLVIALAVIPLISMGVDFGRFPEKYLTTYRYQLHNKIKSGNQEAIDYYNRVYVANGINLFEE